MARSLTSQWLWGRSKQGSGQTVRSGSRRRCGAAKSTLERMEDRVLLSTFLVNSTVDAPDSNPNDNVCATVSGSCTLRAAIQQANATAGADVVSVPAGTYLLTRPGSGEDMASTGDLDITESLMIQGAGAATTIIDARALDRVVHILSVGQQAPTVEIRGVTLKGGVESDGAGVLLSVGTLKLSDVRLTNGLAARGGGLFNDGGTVDISDSVIADNTAQGDGRGGGIFSTAGSVSLTHSTITGNLARGAPGADALGGGIYSETSTWTIIESTVSSNNAVGGNGTAGSGGGSGRGGGIYSRLSTVTITRSTISQNRATGGTGGSNGDGGSGLGGGIYADLVSTFPIQNSTISDNVAMGGSGGPGGNGGSGIGGGIFNDGSGTSTTALLHVTLASNQAIGGGEGSPNGTGTVGSGTAGGFFNVDGSTADSTNTILASNLATTSSPDVSGFFNSHGHNLVGDAGGSTGFGGTDLVGNRGTPINPRLEPLRDNGGFTFTRGLLSDSPAIDAGDNTQSLPTDQRNVSRPIDGNGDGVAVVDIGAFEGRPGIDLEKTTQGSPNGNSTQPADFDNEDAPNGAGVPVLTPQNAVTWTYKVTNAGDISFPAAQVTVTDSVPGINAMLVIDAASSDGVLSPGEVWFYKATGQVLDLGGTPAGTTVVQGCGNVNTGSLVRNTYENSGAVTVPGASDSDLSHYCNPKPSIDIEKTTSGSPNGNATPANFDNEDGANGTGIPVLTPGTAVTWTYKVTNTGTVTIPLAQVTVTDSVPGITPVRVTPDFVGDNDNLLEPGEMWKYVATGTVLDLSQSLPPGTTIVQGCGSVNTGNLMRNTYENSGLVTVPGTTDSDLSHYCNPPPGIDIEKTTTGSPNGNATAPDFDNEDGSNGTGVPVLTPGTAVTWTYKVTNTGTVTIPLSQVTVTDSVAGVTPLRVTPDFAGNNDNLLEPGEMWKYVATGTVLDLSQSPLPPGTTIVQGCGSVNTGNLVRNTYENRGLVTVPGAMDSDLSHYCNAPPGIDIEKTITGSPNGNATPADFDNEDSSNGTGVPVLTPGMAVTWTYKVTSTGSVAVPQAQVTVTDSVPGVTPVRVTPDFVGDNDNMLEPGEMWKYVATGTVLDLGQSPVGTTVVQGCGNVNTGSLVRNTYQNRGTVIIPGATDSDLSHYCNPPPGIDIEKTTTGSPNGNATTPDFDNEDPVNGAGIPVLTPGTAVTWNYKVTNTGTVTITLAQVTVTDSVPGVTPARVRPDFVGDNDNLLEPGEMWKYVATGTVLDLGQSPLPAGTTIGQGCGNVNTGSLVRNTYENSGVVTVPGTTDSDLSHYCNPKPSIDIEKTTTGSPNGNANAADFDNEDSPNGAAVPVLTPGTAATWTYKVTNKGAVTIPLAQVTVTDSVPGVTPGRVTPDIVGDSDNLLEPNEVWKYVATGTVLNLAALPLGGAIVMGCNNVPVGAPPRNTYENNGTVTVPGATDSDLSHYCNPPPGAPDLLVTKAPDQVTVTAGQTIGFSIQVCNTGTAAATGVMLNDPLPDGSGGDIFWTIDTSNSGLGAGTNPAAFQIVGPKGSQMLIFAGQPISLAAAACLKVHITSPTNANDVTFGGVINPSISAYLGAAGDYSVLYMVNGVHTLQITNVTIGGNIGVRGDGKVSFSGPGTIGGRLDFESTNTGQLSNKNGSNVGPNSVNYNVAGVTSAVSKANSLNTSLGALPGTNLVIHGTQTINASAGIHSVIAGVDYRVFNVTSYSGGDGKLVTINDDLDCADPVVVFNFSFNSNVNLRGDVALGGGLTDDQVVWNFTTSGKDISLNNNASSYPTLAFHGIILAPNDGISLVNANFSGRVFGGNSRDMQIVSGDRITAPLTNTATVTASNVTFESDDTASATITINPRRKSLVAGSGSGDSGGGLVYLASGELLVAVQDPEGTLDSNEWARIREAIALVNTSLAGYGVYLTEVSGDREDANLRLHSARTSPCGGARDGVLGCTFGRDITLIEGWNWYTGSDATAVGSNQYDYETMVLHELGHGVGLNHTRDTNSAMFPALSTGEARRRLTEADRATIGTLQRYEGPGALAGSFVRQNGIGAGHGPNCRHCQEILAQARDAGLFGKVNNLRIIDLMSAATNPLDGSLPTVMPVRLYDHALSSGDMRVHANIRDTLISAVASGRRLDTGLNDLLGSDAELDSQSHPIHHLAKDSAYYETGLVAGKPEATATRRDQSDHDDLEEVEMTIADMLAERTLTP